MKHDIKVRVPGTELQVGDFFIDPEDLAYQMSLLRYDKLQELLVHLSHYVYQDSIKDRANNRPQLGEQLEKASQGIYTAGLEIHKAWKICEKYMALSSNGKDT